MPTMRPDETFEQMQMRLALDTIRVLEEENEAHKKSGECWRQSLHNAYEENVSNVNVINVLRNDITQLEAELASEQRSNKERAKLIEELQALVESYARAARYPAPTPQRSAPATEYYNYDRWCEFGDECDDVTCRGHW